MTLSFALHSLRNTPFPANFLCIRSGGCAEFRGYQPRKIPKNPSNHACMPQACFHSDPFLPPNIPDIPTKFARSYPDYNTFWANKKG